MNIFNSEKKKLSSLCSHTHIVQKPDKINVLDVDVVKGNAAYINFLCLFYVKWSFYVLQTILIR